MLNVTLIIAKKMTHARTKTRWPKERFPKPRESWRIHAYSVLLSFLCFWWFHVYHPFHQLILIFMLIFWFSILCCISMLHLVFWFYVDFWMRWTFSSKFFFGAGVRNMLICDLRMIISSPQMTIFDPHAHKWVIGDLLRITTRCKDGLHLLPTDDRMVSPAPDGGLLASDGRTLGQTSASYDHWTCILILNVSIIRDALWIVFHVSLTPCGS